MSTKQPLTLTQSDGPEPILVDARGVAKLLGVSRATVFAMRSRGQLPKPIRVTPRAPRWDVAELRRWCAAGAPPADIWERWKGSGPR